MTSASALQIKHLSKAYGALVVTDDVSISVAPSSIHALIGPNGAGKSTLIGQISGELLPDAGQIALLGEEITQLGPEDRARRGLSRSYQISSILRDFSVLENVLLAIRAQRASVLDFWPGLLKRRVLIDRCYEVLREVALGDFSSTIAARLSYGQRRQLELAMAISQEPKVLLLDEPLAGMSPSESEQIVGLIQRLAQRHAILLVEHDMPAVFALASEVTVLVRGQVIASGTPNAIRDDVAVRAAYLGEEEIVP
jgi:branched-chain amino acid transport system ATP-binding protein